MQSDTSTPNTENNRQEIIEALQGGIAFIHNDNIDNDRTFLRLSRKKSELKQNTSHEIQPIAKLPQPAPPLAV